MHKKTVGILLAVVVITLFAGRLAVAGDCSEGPNYYSTACLYAHNTGERYGGSYAEWAGEDLNITQSAAQAGEHIQHALWFDGYRAGFPPHDDHTWLEVGDTAGTGQIAGHENQWERWFFWVDGWADGFYQENALAPTTTDHLSRFFQIEYTPYVSPGHWSVYVGTPQGTMFGGLQWVDPTVFTDSSPAVGIEVSPRGMNADTNSGVFHSVHENAYNIVSAQWELWPHATAQIDQVCGAWNPPYCLWGQSNFYYEWQSNKPSQ